MTNLTSPKSVLFDARHYISFWFQSTRTSPADAKKRSTVASIKLDYMAAVQVYKDENPKERITALRLEALDLAYVEYLELSVEQERTQAIASIKGTGENLQPVIAWVKAVTGGEDQLDIAIMAHWVWMVKRRTQGRQVIHHIMPIVFGPQGGGKSFAIRKLIEPLKTHRANLKISDLHDNRLYQSFSENFIAFFDELQGADKVDLNVLKNLVDTDVNSFRKLYTHDMITLPMVCSFIGATNKYVDESLVDSTGMRRFWELKAPKQLDWAAVNSIDYAALWFGVDENREDGYLRGEDLRAVRQHQEQKAIRDDIDLFLDEHKVVADGETHKLMTRSEVYQAYVMWAQNNGMNIRFNSPWFTKKLKNRGVPIVDNSDGRFFKVNPNCSASPFYTVKQASKTAVAQFQEMKVTS